MTSVWKSKVPSKIQVFGWRCLKDRVATKYQLFKKGIITNDNDRLCTVCSTLCESLDHLLFSCASFKLVWSNVASWVSILLSTTEMVVSHLLWFENAMRGKAAPSRRLLIWLSTCQVLWNARNVLVFKNEQHNVDNIAVSAKTVS